MPSLFTKIISGEIPGRFVWKDDRCVAFLSIRPLKPGHTLVVPRQEIDHWLDLEPGLARHLHDVAQHIGKAMMAAFHPEKIGLMVAGLEVRHVHYHLVPITAVGDLDFAKQDLNATPRDLDQAAEAIRASLKALGYPQVSA
jgi:histidine triad (HIT) family protein